MDKDTPPRYIAESTQNNNNEISNSVINESKRKMPNNTGEQNINVQNDTDETSNNSVMTFGDDLDVPAFIRNRRR